MGTKYLNLSISFIEFFLGIFLATHTILGLLNLEDQIIIPSTVSILTASLFIYQLKEKIIKKSFKRTIFEIVFIGLFLSSIISRVKL